MEQIRVFLGAMPRLLREMIGSAISDAPDMSVVGNVDDETELVSSLERTDADVLVVSVRDQDEAAALEPILYSRPRLTLLTIGGHGRSAMLHELRPFDAALGEVSPSGLLAAIRSSAAGKVR